MTYNSFKILNFRILLILFSLLYFLLPVVVSAQNKIPETYCMSADEMQLFNRLNELRTDYNKPELKLSVSLSYVAHTHVNDLQINRPDTSICGLSSWSDKGNWKACCYNPYVLNEKCMWDKPKELTSYPYRGYEMVTFFEDHINIDSVMQIWSTSKEVLDMLLTREKYGQKKWICMGIGINDHYVSVWFGQRTDGAARPHICDTVSVTTTDTIVNPTPGKAFYYLIYGSFDNMKDAKEALKRIRKNNFPEAGILEENKRRRIYLGKYSNLKEATFAKQNLPSAYREAWIFKK